jgi:hypothetical protein
LQAAEFDFAGHGGTLRLPGAGEPLWIGIGQGLWMPGATLELGLRKLGKVAAAGAWSAEDTYVARIWAYETPFCITATCHFEGDQVTLSLAFNVGMRPAEPTVIKGRL